MVSSQFGDDLLNHFFGLYGGDVLEVRHVAMQVTFRVEERLDQRVYFLLLAAVSGLSRHQLLELLVYPSQHFFGLSFLLGHNRVHLDFLNRRLKLLVFACILVKFSLPYYVLCLVQIFNVLAR